MTGTNVNKVNPGNEGSANEETKEEKKGKVDFPIKEAMYRNAEDGVVTAVNGDGLLVAVPVPLKEGKGDEAKVIYTGYNIRKHLPLKKSDFACIHTYIRYQAYVARMKALALVKSAEEKEKKASRIEKFGDEATRKKATKVARLREQLAVLEKGLKDEGVDITDL